MPIFIQAIKGKLKLQHLKLKFGQFNNLANICELIEELFKIYSFVSFKFKFHVSSHLGYDDLDLLIDKFKSRLSENAVFFFGNNKVGRKTLLITGNVVV